MNQYPALTEHLEMLEIHIVNLLQEDLPIERESFTKRKEAFLLLNETRLAFMEANQWLKHPRTNFHSI